MHDYSYIILYISLYVMIDLVCFTLVPLTVTMCAHSAYEKNLTIDIFNNPTDHVFARL